MSTGQQPATVPREPPIPTTMRVIWLAALVYAVAAATAPGTSGRHLAALILTVSTALGWGSWLAGRHRDSLRASLAGIVVLAVTGGVMVVLHPIGVAVVAVAALSAGSSLELLPAAALTAPSVVAAAVAVVVTGHDATVIGNAASGMVAGLVVGLGRRQAQERTRRDAELVLAQQRTQLEHDRAEVLAERNRIAREVHDVLAHTLSALSVQLEALSSLVDEHTDPRELQDAVARSRRLVVGGLEETRRAVRMLRDEPVDVAEQLALLAHDGDAVFTLAGQPRHLSPQAGLAVVRVGQEALTNARKHSPGARVSITLLFDDDTVAVTVDNDAATGPSQLASTGGGYGLVSMRERVELAGGCLTAGPYGDGWRVRAEVPA